MRYRFLGLEELIPVQEERLGDGTEIIYYDYRCGSRRGAMSLVRPKTQLGAFRSYQQNQKEQKFIR